jgi:hypothetical protein
MRTKTRLIINTFFPETVRNLRIGFPLLVAFIWVACPFAVSAQQGATATLRGIVRDPNGATVAGAKVVAKQTELNAPRDAVTNSDGLYVLTNLQPGPYVLTIQASGFALRTFSEVVLQVGQSATLDATLEVGAVTAKTELYGDLSLVDTSSSAVAGTLDQREIKSLPLNGRNYLELAFLVPGNSPAPNFDPTKTNTVVVSSAGQLGRGGNVTVDGADNNDDVVGGAVQNISQEAVQEFQMATNRFSAELGRSGSSVVNVVTKSGTNDLHGSDRYSFAIELYKVCQRLSIAGSVKIRHSIANSMPSPLVGR